jgi:hypothetical protein
VKLVALITKGRFDCGILTDDKIENLRFCGKVGRYPIVKTTLALRNSSHRKKGTVILKCMSITAAVYRDSIVNKLLPDIVQCCPLEM